MAEQNKENVDTIHQQDTKVNGEKATLTLVSNNKKRKSISNASDAGSSKQRKASAAKDYKPTSQLSLLVAKSLPIFNRGVAFTGNRSSVVSNAANHASLAAKHAPPVATNLHSSVKRLSFDETPKLHKKVPSIVNRMPLVANRVPPANNKRRTPITATPVPLSQKRSSATTTVFTFGKERSVNSLLSASNLVPSAFQCNRPADACTSAPSTNSGANRAPVAAANLSIDFPVKFHVGQKWKFVDCQRPRASGIVDAELAAHTAAVCYNARGAISHGQVTQIHYTRDAFKPFLIVQSIFDHMGGFKHLSSVQEIKKELMENGPIVSTSFVLPRPLLDNEKYSSAFLKSRVEMTHEVVIVGWMTAAAGQFWLVKSLDAYSPPVPIAMGHFGIDDCCVSPIVNFSSVVWQNGPYFDAEFSSDEWMEWRALLLDLSDAEMQDLACCFKTGLLAASRQGSTFVIRNKNKFAHSRRYRLKEISWNKETSKWTVSAEKV